MSQEQWTAVDRYFTDLLHARRTPRWMRRCAASAAAGLPPISVSPKQGKLLHLLARVHGARRILEIGTLGGYSTIWLARALPGGRPADHAGSRRRSTPRSPARNIARAGPRPTSSRCASGAALDTLPALAAEGAGPFDLVFIDADKASNADYFDWALKLSRRGSLIIVDNVVRDGEVVDADQRRRRRPGGAPLQRAARRRAARVGATAIQTVGSKGYDGLVIALVTADA